MRSAGRTPLGEDPRDHGSIDAGEVIEEGGGAVAGGDMIEQGLERDTGAAENRHAAEDLRVTHDVGRKSVGRVHADTLRHRRRVA